MLNLTSHHSSRISNGLAVFAALLLLVSSLSGFNASGLTSKGPAGQPALIQFAPTQFFASEAPAGDTHKMNKSFKVSLFLFRID